MQLLFHFTFVGGSFAFVFIVFNFIRMMTVVFNIENETKETLREFTDENLYGWEWIIVLYLSILMDEPFVSLHSDSYTSVTFFLVFSVVVIFFAFRKNISRINTIKFGEKSYWTLIGFSMLTILLTTSNNTLSNFSIFLKGIILLSYEWLSETNLLNVNDGFIRERKNFLYWTAFKFSLFVVVFYDFTIVTVILWSDLFFKIISISWKNWKKHKEHKYSFIEEKYILNTKNDEAQTPDKYTEPHNDDFSYTPINEEGKKENVDYGTLENFPTMKEEEKKENVKVLSKPPLPKEDKKETVDHKTLSIPSPAKEERKENINYRALSNFLQVKKEEKKGKQERFHSKGKKKKI